MPVVDSFSAAVLGAISKHVERPERKTIYAMSVETRLTAVNV